MFGAPSDNFKAKLGYGDVGTYASAGNPVSNVLTKPVWLLDLNYKVNKDWSVNGAMYYATNAGDATLTGINPATGNITYTDGYPFQVYNLGFVGKLSQDFKWTANYFWNAASVVADAFPDDQHTGWMTEVWYKGADRAKVNSWGLAVNYREIKPFAIDLANVSGMMGNSMTGACPRFSAKKAGASRATTPSAKMLS